MAKPGTSRIVLESLTQVARHFGTIHDLADFQRIFPYRTMPVQDEASLAQHLLAPLPNGYVEHRLYITDGRLLLGTIDLAFSLKRELVNFSLFVTPREWFKRKAVKDCITGVLFPFLRENWPDAQMTPGLFGSYLFPDPRSGLTFQLRPHLHERVCIGIGIAIFVSEGQ
jgi:hypothetical protein